MPDVMKKVCTAFRGSEAPECSGIWLGLGAQFSEGGLSSAVYTSNPRESSAPRSGDWDLCSHWPGALHLPLCVLGSSDQWLETSLSPENLLSRGCYGSYDSQRIMEDPVSQT